MSNPTSVVTERRLGAFYQEILPYLGGSADAGFTPVGSVIAIMGVTAPANYLACNGQIVNVADYPELANYFEQQFGTKYKFGGSGTTFGIPDLRGEFLRGTGTNSHTDGGNGGSVGVHQGATTIPNIGVDANASKIMFHNNATAEYIVNGDKAVKSSTKGSDITASTSWNTTTQSSFYIRPTNTSVLWCIATKDIYLNPAMDYSTEEKIIGTWVDGKPVYQKSFQITNAGIVVAQTGTGTSIFDATSLNIANVIEPISGYCDWGDSSFQTLPTSFMTQEQWVVCDLYYNPLTKIISFRGQRKTGSTSVNNIWFTVRYTKTT